MGVDKDNVGLVVHYEISDSLENYVQEAGRAGRNESINADCYVLFNDNDLDRHFTLLTQTKLSLNEIQQVWRAVKELSRQRDRFTRTPLEIARTAGWDENIANLETKVKTAIAALENAGYNLNESLMGNVLKIPVLKTESNYRELLEKYGFEYYTAEPGRDIRELLKDTEIRNSAKLALAFSDSARDRCEMDLSRYYAVTMWELR